MTAAALRVLVVEDCPDTARMMKVLLRADGHEARTAGDGASALEVARSFTPDVVLLDRSLPDMDGAVVAESLRDMPGLSGCVLVAVSGYDDESLGPASPFGHHFGKPLDHEALLEFLSGIRPLPPSAGEPEGTGPAA